MNPLHPHRQRLLDKVVDFYQKTFLQTKAGQTFLTSLDLGSPAMWQAFAIGYADGSLLDTVPRIGELRRELMSIGILDAKGRERFHGCLVFPAYGPHSVVAALYGVRMNGKGESPCLPCPTHGIVNYGCGQAHETILLVPALLDACAVWQSGWKNVTCCHHGPMTKDTLKYFEANQTETIYLVGRHPASVSKALNGAGIETITVLIPKGKDVRSFLQANSSAAFDILLKRATRKAQVVNPAAESADIEPKPNGFTLRFKRRAYDVTVIENTPVQIRAVVKAITNDRNRFHIDTVELMSAKSRKVFITDAARLHHCDESVITGDMNAIVIQCNGSTEQPEREAGKGVDEKEQQEAQQFGKTRHLLDAIARDVERCGYVGEKANVLLAYLTMTSRKMNNPLALLIVSGSGAGKSTLQDTVLSLCPDEDVVKVTALTERALFYKDERSLKHKVLALEERAGAEDADYAIRNLISAKVLIIESTVKDHLTGKLMAVQNRVSGPTAVFQTTTQPDFQPETRSRFLITSIDESSEQTRRILDVQRRARMMEGFRRKHERDAIVKKHHAFQRCLKPVKVFNPFADRLSFADDRLRMRREQPKYLALMEVIAFVRQMQKPVRQVNVGGQSHDYVDVDVDDIEVANQLAVDVIGRSSDELSVPSRRLLSLAVKWVEREGKEGPEALFTRRELREFSHWSDYQIRTYLRQLVELEYVEQVTGRNGQLYRYRLVSGGKTPTTGLNLKSVEELRKEANLAEPCETLRKWEKGQNPRKRARK